MILMTVEAIVNTVPPTEMGCPNCYPMSSRDHGATRVIY